MSDIERTQVNDASPALRAISNERGAVMAFVALLLLMFLGVAALAIDLGMLYVARGEAQRAADAAAHAGAGHLQIVQGDEEGARDAAVAFANRNTIRGEAVEIDRDDDIEVFLVDEQRVRVTVRRTTEWGGPVRTIMAQVLGSRAVDVSAVAAAQVWSVDQSTCMLPVALPDRWCESGSGGTCTEWPGLMDSFDPDNDGDYYVEWERGMQGEYTGYSIDDIGEYIYLRPEAAGGGQGQGQGSGGERWNPSWWAPFHAPAVGYGGQSVPDLAAVIQGCSDVPLGVGSEVEPWNGNAANPLKQAWDSLIAQDDSATWNFTLDCVVNKDLTSPTKEDCRKSPRQRPIGLFNPYQGPTNASTPFELTRLAAVFVDEVEGSGSNLQVRTIFAGFSGDIPGSSGAGSGDFVTMLRIVE